MIKFILLTTATLLSARSFAEITLSRSVYEKVSFSSQFIEDGALIRNVNYNAVKELIPQLEKKYRIELKTRGEAHITVITPPEAQGWFTPDRKGINYLIDPIEIHHRYFPTLQNTDFNILCVGKQENDNGNLVFYLVVQSEELFKVRSDIQRELESRAKFTGKKTHFNANNFYPHITIGYVKGDVHGVSKGKETCVEDLRIF